MKISGIPTPALALDVSILKANGGGAGGFLYTK